MVKFLFIFTLIFVVMLLIVPLIAFGRPIADSFNEILTEGRVVMGLIVLYAFLYPLINFVNVKRHLNGSFESNRKFFEEAFTETGYEKTSETGDSVTYRKKTGIARAMLFWDDEVVLNTTSNPVIISGVRKIVTRINRIIERNILREEGV